MSQMVALIKQLFALVMMCFLNLMYTIFWIGSPLASWIPQNACAKLGMRDWKPDRLRGTRMTRELFTGSFSGGSGKLGNR